MMIDGTVFYSTKTRLFGESKCQLGKITGTMRKNYRRLRENSVAHAVIQLIPQMAFLDAAEILSSR
jgi:hypothetical protein